MENETLVQSSAVIDAVYLSKIGTWLEGTESWWAHQDSNLEPKRYEHSALTIELWALIGNSGTTVIDRK
jgi:hypothetical protein